MHPADGRVVSNFIIQALNNEPLTIFGDGSQTRSFCYVDDMTEGLIRMMAAPDHLTGPLNLGNPVEYTIQELAEAIVRLSGSSSQIIQQPLPADDPKRRRPDISLARKALDWEPKVGLEQGLGLTIDYFRDLLEQEA
jgi:UDP-glucuronate decarboxylase